MRVPQGWSEAAQRHWTAGERQAAINAVLTAINAHSGPKPVDLVLQLAYYAFLSGDARSAAAMLERGRAEHPRHPSLLLNLAVCLARTGQNEAALMRVREYLLIRPEDPVAHDSLASTLSSLGHFAEAAAAGTHALVLKDRAVPSVPRGWRLPDMSPDHWTAGSGNKRNVVAFSLWGSNPRYLRGALDNALAMKIVYPGWVPIFYVEESVPCEILDALRSLGAELRYEPSGQSLLQRLSRRFAVANDDSVGRFLVRDADSVVNARERAAVDGWIASGRWFHVMRDWWTHSDLVLAGMWGGVAGVLPPLGPRLASYQPNEMETPNVDQLFLRDVVWAYLRTSCLVHDRCFSPPGAQPWPVAAPAGNEHVGQDENVRGAAQEKRLAEALASYPGALIRCKLTTASGETHV